jgi:small subunit ribosomal protein S8
MNRDNLSYFLAHLNLAFKQKRLEVVVSNTKLIQQSLSLLVSLGYINSFLYVNSKQIRVFLRYDEYGKSVIRGILRVSRPGARIYVSYKQLNLHWSRLNNLNNTYQNVILSTSKGLLLHHYAIKEKVGGEVLFIIN